MTMDTSRLVQFRFLHLVILLGAVTQLTGFVQFATTFSQRRIVQRQMESSITKLLDTAPKAGTFFNPVPEGDGNNDSNDASDDDITSNKGVRQESILDAFKLNNPGTSGIGFGPPSKQLHTPKNQKPFVGIGPPLNDVTKPEYDEKGYTLYADERTGKKSRVFEALVDYPCSFTMKIVGDGTNSGFVTDILIIVAESCEVEYTGPETIQHSIRTNGKWISITVEAPVKSAEMLYQLYENVDRDPRVKFKF